MATMQAMTDMAQAIIRITDDSGDVADDADRAERYAGLLTAVANEVRRTMGWEAVALPTSSATASSYGTAVSVSDGWSILPVRGQRIVRMGGGWAGHTEQHLGAGCRWVPTADARPDAVFPSAAVALRAAEISPGWERP